MILTTFYALFRLFYNIASCILVSYFIAFLRQNIKRRKYSPKKERERKMNARLAIWIPNHRLVQFHLAYFSLFLLFVFRPGSLRPFHVYLRAPRIFRRDTLSLCRSPGPSVAKITPRKKVRVILLKSCLFAFSHIPCESLISSFFTYIPVQLDTKAMITCYISTIIFQSSKSINRSRNKLQRFKKNFFQFTD